MDFQTQSDKGELSSYIPNGEWELLGRFTHNPGLNNTIVSFNYLKLLKNIIRLETTVLKATTPHPQHFNRPNNSGLLTSALYFSISSSLHLLVWNLCTPHQLSNFWWLVCSVRMSHDLLLWDTLKILKLCQ